MFGSSVQSFTRVPSGSICLCVFMSVCLRFPLPGSFDLFNASNGTSKEDFSEFDSLRSSSSVLTGTHPCLCLCPHGVCVVSPSLSVTSHLHHSVSGVLQTGPFQLATLAALFCCFWRGFLATVWYWSGSVCFNWVWNGDPGEQKRKPGRTTSKEKAAVETQAASPSQGLCRLIKHGW